eukprot:m51a1_g1875 hypothetical protein (256) ;mRNA; r:675944-676979
MSGSSDDEAGPGQDERVVLNVGGKRYEVYVSTLLKYPSSLLGAMFHPRNAHLRRPDASGEYFFDRCGDTFAAVVNFYRTGRLLLGPNTSPEALEAEMDFWQLPSEAARCSMQLGDAIAALAISRAREKVRPQITALRSAVLERVRAAALEGQMHLTLEYAAGASEYDFLNVLSNRELLLHDLRALGVEASISSIATTTAAGGHMYVLAVVLWSQYSQRERGPPCHARSILAELRQGVEVKTTHIDHVLSTTKFKL